MKKKQKLPEVAAELMNQMQKVQRLAKELSVLIAEADHQDASPSNIISFPVSTGSIPDRSRPSRTGRRIIDTRQPFGCLIAVPGSPLPDAIVDYRPLLQRDGLILLSWDKRITEMGERYTAYWVTSAGIPRFYASLSLPPEGFPAARPNHKSYAAEDGIEFYGQDAPVYMVHVAPELMMNNPQHGELRQAHIQMLKEQGSAVDFTYKYLLKTEKEKNRELSRKKPPEWIAVRPDGYGSALPN